MLIVFGNYGNHTLALIQWLFDFHNLVLQKFPHLSKTDIYCVSIDTGWHPDQWQQHVYQAEKYVATLGFNIVRLKAKPNFVDLALERGHFPSQKFQWCASFLKGITLLDWLEENDPEGQAVIVSGKRHADFPNMAKPSEWCSSSEHYQGRSIYYPLLNLPENEFYSLIKKTGFEPLSHRSLECEPCIHQKPDEFARLRPQDLERVQLLEKHISKPFFEKNIEEYIKEIKNINIEKQKYYHSFYMGCGSPFACGE